MLGVVIIILCHFEFVLITDHDQIHTNEGVISCNYLKLVLGLFHQHVDLDGCIFVDF
jgi:hypothetical protein